MVDGGKVCCEVNLLISNIIVRSLRDSRAEVLEKGKFGDEGVMCKYKILAGSIET